MHTLASRKWRPWWYIEYIYIYITRKWITFSGFRFHVQRVHKRQLYQYNNNKIGEKQKMFKPCVIRPTKYGCGSSRTIRLTVARVCLTRDKQISACYTVTRLHTYTFTPRTYICVYTILCVCVCYINASTTVLRVGARRTGGNKSVTESITETSVLLILLLLTLDWVVDSILIAYLQSKLNCSRD